MDPDVTLGNGRESYPSCALLGGFAIGARVSLLWQHTRLMRNVSEDDCIRSMAGLSTFTDRVSVQDVIDKFYKFYRMTPC